MGLLAVNKDLMLPNHKQCCVGEDDLFLMEIEHGGEKHISRTQETSCLIIELFLSA